MYGNEFGTPLSLLASSVAAARVAHLRGEREGAARQLATARAEGARFGAAHLEIALLLLEADLAFSDGEEDRGLALLRHALSAGARAGVDRILPLYPHSIVAACCERALAAGIEVAQARALVLGCRLTPGPAAVLLEDWPWRFKIHAFGRFRIEKDGEPLALPGRRSSRPLALLKALLALGGGEAPGWKLAEALWPDADGDRAQTSLKTTLHRLRRLLGDERVIVMRDGRLTLDSGRCWVDLWAFERAAGLTGRSTSDGELALRLYGGAFLADDDDLPWAVGPRAAWRDEFRRVVTAIARAHLERGDDASAAEVRGRAAKVDPGALAVTGRVAREL